MEDLLYNISMSWTDVMNKIRYWDHTFARWMLRHVYYMFFQLVLLVVFLFWLFNVFSVIEVTSQTEHGSTLEKILRTQSINTTVIVFLLFLNSFWLLYIFSSIQRIGNLLRDLNFQLSRSKIKNIRDRAL